MAIPIRRTAPFPKDTVRLLHLAKPGERNAAPRLPNAHEESPTRKAMTKEEETKKIREHRPENQRIEDEQTERGHNTGGRNKKREGGTGGRTEEKLGGQGTNQKSGGGTKVILRSNAEGAYNKDEQRKQKEKDRVTIVFAISSTRDRRQRGNRERK
ncbi:hypothetical protein NC651_039418 [Populus alba x Populus x berolinensis]|nr:hypothetical protein NC651_039418 [Populus alba x Populus x berolinensis]